MNDVNDYKLVCAICNSAGFGMLAFEVAEERKGGDKQEDGGRSVVRTYPSATTLYCAWLQPNHVDSQYSRLS